MRYFHPLHQPSKSFIKQNRELIRDALENILVSPRSGSGRSLGLSTLGQSEASPKGVGYLPPPKKKVLRKELWLSNKKGWFYKESVFLQKGMWPPKILARFALVTSVIKVTP